MVPNKSPLFLLYHSFRACWSLRNNSRPSTRFSVPLSLSLAYQLSSAVPGLAGDQVLLLLLILSFSDLFLSKSWIFSCFLSVFFCCDLLLHWFQRKWVREDAELGAQELLQAWSNCFPGDGRRLHRCHPRSRTLSGSVFLFFWILEFEKWYFWDYVFMFNGIVLLFF